MLNINKIHSLINSGDSKIPKIAKGINIPYSTLKSKLKADSWTPDDVEKIADFFQKPITYFFDRDDNSVNEPNVTTYSCPDCIKKQKEIDRLQKDKDEIKDKYIKCLEQLANSKGGNQIANSA